MSAEFGSESLTERETDVLLLVGDGRKNCEIAADLFINVETVKSHLASARRKIGARDRVAAALWAAANLGSVPLLPPAGHRDV